MRIGIGYDVHKIKSGRELILGGIKLDSIFGLDGHSDADVLVHSIMDAMLGALALVDIGKHFPDTDNKYKGISSMKLLSHVNKLIADEGYKIINIDSIIAAQMPKIAPYIEKIRGNIADALKLDISQVSVKATTEEGLGFTGEMLGMSARAIVLLERIVL